MRQPPLSVFVSHSSELNRFPADRTFIDAAISGVIRSGNVPCEMEYFVARDQKPADYCRDQVSSSNVYIGVLGFRYGSRVRDEPDLSYTELEFDAAGAAGIPRLVFLLDQNAPIPVELVDANREKQEAFRSKAKESSITTKYFSTPAELELAIYQTLTELNDSGALAKPGRVPWMAPPPWRTVVPRPELEARLTSVLDSAGNRSVGLTTVLQGAGGFGKTTLAAEVSRSAGLRERFPDGLLWVTIGEQTKDASLASKINDLAEVISGHRPTLSDPEQAGYHLSEVLGQKACLIVIDDVWERGQLRPFLQDAPNCTRLITTRNHGILPADGVSIVVDAMENPEARALLTQGLDHFPEAQLNSLLRLTGRWPVLLALVNSYVRRVVASGLSVEQAAQRVSQRLLGAGPAALDVSRPNQRDEAVSATIETSLSLLSRDHLDRYLELSIFPEDTHIPLDVLGLLWGRPDISAEWQCEQFADLSLLQSFQLNPPGIRMHDVVRTYLRGRCGAERLVQMNEQLLDVAKRHIAVMERGEASPPWWHLPAEMTYLWANLAYHLSEADRIEELAGLVCDLRWICAKVDRLGPVETETDLARVDRPVAVELRRALGRCAHLLTPIAANVSLRDTVLSRLDGVAALGEVTRAFMREDRKPWLRPARSLPDRPHYALRRILASPMGRLLACAAMPDGRSIVGGGEDRHLRVWDVDSGQTRLVMEGHDGPVWCCAASPDGTWLISGSDDQTVRIWDALTGECQAILRHPRAAVRACLISPDGSWLASAGDDLTVQIWDRGTATVRLVMAGHEGVVRTLTVSPDGSWLASAGDDLIVRIWDTRTGALRLTLTGHTASVWAAMAGPDGTWLATAGLDRTVRIWDPATGSLLRRLETPSGPVLACGDSPQGKWLATGGDEGTIQIWDLDSGDLRGVLEGHSGRVRASSADPRGQWLATGGDDQSVRTWDVWAVGAKPADEEPIGLAWAVAAAAYGPTTVAAGADGRLRLWQQADDPLAVLSVLPVPPWTVAIDPKATRVAAGGQDGRIWIWETASGSRVASIDAHPGSVWACSFTPEGDRLITAGEDHAVRLWDVASGGLVSEYTEHRSPVRCCALGPNGSCCVSGSDDGEARVWDVSSQRTLKILTGHTGRIWACALSPHGDWIATAGDDLTLRVWDRATGETRAVFKDHTKRVRGCASNADGTLLVSVSADQTFRIWDVGQAQCIAAVRVALPLSGCCWSASRRSVLAVGDGGIYDFHFAR